MATTPEPITLRMWPENPLGEVFTTEVIEKWKRSRQATKELVNRWAVLEADGSYHPASPRASHGRGLRALKAAWDVYLSAAFACQLFDGTRGKDIRGRLTSKDPDAFRAAMAECLACWYLAGKHKLSINPAAPGRGAKNLEMVAFWKQTNFGVEVKAPNKPSPENGVGVGDDSEKLEEALNTANKQFDNKGPNLLILVPTLPIPMYHHRESLMHALYGRSKITFKVSKKTGGKVGPEVVKFFPEGKLFNTKRPDGIPLKPDGTPGYRRTSAVLCIEEITVEKYPSEFFFDEKLNLIRPWWPEGLELHGSHTNQMVIDHNAVVLHNPYAYHPLDQTLFAHLPQCIPIGNTMQWTDGYDAVV